MRWQEWGCWYDAETFEFNSPDPILDLQRMSTSEAGAISQEVGIINWDGPGYENTAMVDVLELGSRTFLIRLQIHEFHSNIPFGHFSE